MRPDSLAVEVAAAVFSGLSQVTKGRLMAVIPVVGGAGHGRVPPTALPGTRCSAVCSERKASPL
jgi:hypothetical protein